MIPLFTRAGCNRGACHGKLAGQNGFRLSLRGYAPEEDHLTLTRELYARRANPAFPGESLILKKALGLVPHGGGPVLKTGSREHRLLLAWVEAGMPGPRKDDPAVLGLEIALDPPPARREGGASLLAVGGEAQLSVRARYAGGESRDVTWLARFDTSDGSVVETDASGKIRVLRPGEAAVRASFRTEVAVVVLGAARPGLVPPEAYEGRKNCIDDFVFEKLRALGIEPSGPADDSSFLRRAYLDTIGKLPTPGETRSFLDDPDPRKRERLVDLLLDRPEFVDFWTLELADLFQNRRERDGDQLGALGTVRFGLRGLSFHGSGGGPEAGLRRPPAPLRGDPPQSLLHLGTGEERLPRRAVRVVQDGRSRRGQFPRSGRLSGRAADPGPDRAAEDPPLRGGRPGAGSGEERSPHDLRRVPPAGGGHDPLERCPGRIRGGAGRPAAAGALRPEHVRTELPARPPAHRKGRSVRHHQQRGMGPSREDLGQPGAEASGVRPGLFGAPRGPALARLLSDTLVLAFGEFGRTPKVNKDAGRDHWGPAASLLFAGAGVKGGQVIGATDRQGAYVTQRPVAPADVAFTVYDSLGIDPGTHVFTPDGRPLEILDQGSVVKELF